MSFTSINMDEAGPSSTQPPRTVATVSPKALTARTRRRLAVDPYLGLCTQYGPEEALTRLLSDQKTREGECQMVRQILQWMGSLTENANETIDFLWVR